MDKVKTAKQEKVKRKYKERPYSRMKSILTYVAFVIVPLLIADGIFLYILIRSEQAEIQYEYSNIARNIENEFQNVLGYASTISIDINMSRNVDDFLNKTYTSPAQYYEDYTSIIKKSFIETSAGANNFDITLYTDNDSIINGGRVQKIDNVKKRKWYKYFEQNTKPTGLYFYYDAGVRPATKPKRSVLFLRRLDYYGKKSQRFCCIDVDYSTFARNLCDNVNKSVYLMCGDYVIMSNRGDNSTKESFSRRTFSPDEVGYSEEFESYGKKMQIVILDDPGSVMSAVEKYKWILTLLVFVNAVVPWVFVRLSQSAQIVRLRAQETDIARQNAELLALHSQINPHFLFNALESIRMHSILRGETETAEMVEKLAVIERKNADWNRDFINIKSEMEFVEAYLGLQKYRFGDRLSYEIDVERECENFLIPKLTIVTFVENACVHGIEAKSTPGWIFVRVNRKDNLLIIEVEDTGGGIDDDELDAIREKMDNPSIEKLQQKGRIGVTNACLRLKMATNDAATFDIDSEEGIGTTITITMPISDEMRGDIC